MHLASRNIKITTMPHLPLTVVAIGAGHRSVICASYALKHPERMKLVAVAEPNEHRRNALADAHHVSHDMRFASYQELVARPVLARAAINGTMDGLHYDSTNLLLDRGYDVLLEKPIAPTEREVRDLIEKATRLKRIVMICHVLRYAPFYARLKSLIAAGEIGRITAIETRECVAYHHVAAAFVRGRWNQRSVNPMLLSKCCHDLDIIAWLMSGVPALRVSSFGSRSFFRPENAPAGSAERCLVGCCIESTCPYSACTNYITQNLQPFYAFESAEHMGELTLQQKLDSLKVSPMGRCVWHCDNDVVDRQTVAIEFADGTVGSHVLATGSARGGRTIFVQGTTGELEGNAESGIIKLRKPRLEHGADHTEQTLDVNIAGGGDGHGGGDMLLVEDFVSVVNHEPTSAGATHIADSLTGHLLAFAADRAMLKHSVESVA